MSNVSPITSLESERLVLEKLSLAYCSDTYVDWLNDPDVYQYLETGGAYTKEDLRTYLEDVEKKTIFFWAIILKENNKHIGNIKIDPIHIKNGVGEYGILIGDKTEWGKNYAKEASVLILDFCFKVLKLRKICLGVVAKNTSAVNLYLKLGFKQEGLYEKHALYNNEFCDIIRMAIFKENYLKDE